MSDRSALMLVALGAVIYAMLAGRSADRVSERAEAAADSAYMVHLDDKHALSEAMRAWGEDVLLYSTRADSALYVAAKAEHRRPAIIERVVLAAGPDSVVVRQSVTLVTDSIQANEIRPLYEALALADSIIAADHRALDAMRVANGSTERALELARAEARAWEKQAKPEFLGIRITPERAYAGGVLTAVALLLAIR